MADAVSRGIDMWELFVDNWGNVNAPSADGSSLSFPAVGAPGLPSVAGVAIGPQSTVDRCLINYSLLAGINSQNLWDYVRRVSVGAPSMVLQPGTQEPLTDTKGTGVNNGTLAVYNEPAAAFVVGGASVGTRFGAQYVRADGVAGTFGIAAPDGAKWLSPLLHLLFYIKPPALAPAPKRAPFVYRDSLVAVAAGGVERLGFQVPTFGRKTVAVDITSVEAGTFRVGQIQHLGVVSVGVTYEHNVPSGSGTLTAGATSRVLITNALSDYTMVYYTVAAGGSNVTCSVCAYDD